MLDCLLPEGVNGFILNHLHYNDPQPLCHGGLDSCILSIDLVLVG